ncbi:MAG: hypothetical protein DRI69_09065 [Bacteroidetes bacterium]|nr:MAG: hypothetical protein DRI69_09065 [Bacteroidota bacterium]
MKDHNYFGKAYRPLYSNNSLNGPDIRVLLSVIALGNKHAELETTAGAIIEDAGLKKSAGYSAIKRVTEYGLLSHKNGVYKAVGTAFQFSIEPESKVQDSGIVVQDSGKSFRDSGKVVYLIEEERRKNKKEYPEFDIFYSSYPKKRKKPDAERAFKKHYQSLPSIPELIAIIEKWKLTDDWTKEDGKFIPYPASWLNSMGWEDDLPAIPETEEEEIKRIFG